MQALRDVRREICDVQMILVDVPWDPGTVRQERKMAENMVKAHAGRLLVNKCTVFLL